MAAELDKSHFAEFFAAVNPRLPSGEEATPFPWQLDLVDTVAETGQWPALLDLPTAAGKTAVIDIAVFLMAICDAMPRRIVFVIDRRVVVQQAAIRARRLSELLHDSDAADVVRAVGDKLRAKSAAVNGVLGSPLLWAEMRGGIARDDSWAMRPDVPAILVSTVDQAGSRLLFRGYGVSTGMLPVYAGLLGNDALFLLDEVHLAQPFAETLRMIGERYRPSRATGLPDRWQVVTLSATPGQDDLPEQVLTLSERDRDPLAAPVLARRLAARKDAQKRLVKGRDRATGGQRNSLASEAAKSARAMIEHGQSKVIGVVVNRVGTARRVHDLLRDDGSVERALITGRMRPFDRDDLLRDLLDKIRTGRSRQHDDAPLVVAATQSIEAGADFDFDALVTECASFDALKQRFGRVDRDGQLSASGAHSKSVILALADDVAANADDPIYRTALAKTWDQLPEREFDFAHYMPSEDQLRRMVATRPVAPKLLPSHLDRWVQTSQRPDASPDISLWLHGITSDRAVDVNLVWRADLTEELLAERRSEDAAATVAINLVTACRPGSAEAMSVPLQAVRNWLARLADQERPAAIVQVADVEGAILDNGDDTAPDGATIRPVLRWDGDRRAVARTAGAIRPGDTLIVPARYGGISASNWDPEDRREVSDLGHRVQEEQRLRAVLRLSPGVLAEVLEALPPLPVPADTDELADGDDNGVVGDWLKGADAELNGQGLIGRLVRHLSSDAGRSVDRVRVSLDDDRLSSIYVVSSRRKIESNSISADPQSSGETQNVDTEPDTSSFTGVTISLADHLNHVQRWARAVAGSCGLPDRLASDLALAARLHDVGKADPRFQRMLSQGRVTTGELLAKSLVRASNRTERERARWEAGYPRGGRHELLSVAMVQDQPELAAEASDWDLVLHLIGSHHGYCRPFAPVVHDLRPALAECSCDGLVLRHSTKTELARIDSGVADRFWRLVRRYGWFGLAQLESILRLADHRASASEQLSGNYGSNAKVSS